MARLGRRWILALFGAGLVASSGCLSPTLPLPPPGEPDRIDQVGNQRYLLTGSIPEEGVVETLNTRTGLTFGQVSDGPYSFEITAAPGDAIQLWYTKGFRISETVVFDIPEDEPDSGVPDGGASDGGLPDGAPTD